MRPTELQRIEGCWPSSLLRCRERLVGRPRPLHPPLVQSRAPTYRRVCDDADWQGGFRYETPPTLTAPTVASCCIPTGGTGVGCSLTRVPKGYMAPRSGDVQYNEADQFSTQVPSAMKPLRTWEFKKYRLAKSAVRERMARQYLGIDTKTGGDPDPWLPLRDVFMQLDGTVESLRSRPPRPALRCRDDYVDAYTNLTRTMIAYCDTYRIKAGLV